ncbi:KTSC domain-containing protein [Serratia ureilytica]|uniref:KTSC domain-containing protein n=1 Tax=Serratia ureilytica TaxID=300181 RepID=A0A9X9C0R7_9GAMM|nr:KTSC domain-containing protein [Serratia ureilytica]
MNRFPVSSSNLRSVGYDTQTIILEVELKDEKPTRMHGPDCRDVAVNCRQWISY